mgnify:CR=1 FL=1
MSTTTPPEKDRPFGAFEDQVNMVLEAIRKNPAKTPQILMVYMSNLFEAVKEALRKQGSMPPFYLVMADPIVVGVPPVTGTVLERAKELEAAAVVSVEGFQSEEDIGDMIYHVSMSSPFIGVAGWVLRVKLGNGSVEFARELPYLFDSSEKVKSLGELIDEMEDR